MAKLLRIWGLSLALVACIALFGHADCHCIQANPAASCNLCHSAVFTLPTAHVPAPVFYTQPLSVQRGLLGWEPATLAVHLTRGPPAH